MIKIRISTKIYESDTWEGALEEIKKSTWNHDLPTKEYMGIVNQRNFLMNGRTLNFHNAETFLKELARYGGITILESEVR